MFDLLGYWGCTGFRLYGEVVESGRVRGGILGYWSCIFAD
jgi:hypothetical protein